MKRTFKTLFIFFLVFSIVASLISVYALEVDPYDPPEIPEEYVHLKAITVGLSINSGLAVLSSHARVSSGMTDTVNITMKLQRYNNGSWTTLNTWTGSGTRSCSVPGQLYVTSGYTYRNYVVVTVYTSSGSYVETAYASNSKYY